MPALGTKEFYENYSIISLIDKYKHNLKYIYLYSLETESPDWQSCEMDIGIEVTQAIEEMEGYELSVIRQVFGKGFTPQVAKQKIDKLSNGKMTNKVSEFNGLTIYSYHDGLFNTDILRVKILDSIQRKIIKLNKNFKIFKKNWLYIFAGTSIINIEDILKIKEGYFEIKKLYDVNFDKIFINALDSIYLIELERVRTYKISDKKLDLYKRLALSDNRESVYLSLNNKV